MSDESAAPEGANRPRIAAKPKAPPKRSWWIDKSHVMHCFSSSANDCLIWPLVELPEASGFYDPELGRGTQHINRVLHALAEHRRGSEQLAVIVVQGRPLLVWTHPSGVGPDEGATIGPDDDPDTIGQALGLKLAKGALKREYVLSDHLAVCSKGKTNSCVVDKFWESVEPAGSFYDAELARATKEANAILDGLREAKPPGKELSFIVVESALLLMWTQPAIGPADEPHVIRHALGLKD
jgi:hypothetical protein